MKKLMRKGYLILLVSMMMITCIPAELVMAMQTNTPTLISEITYQEDDQKASIALSIEFDETAYEVKEILDPKGSPMDIDALTYEATLNKDYTFTMHYIEKGDLSKEVKTVSEKVTIDGLKKKESRETPVATSTDGEVSVRFTDGYPSTSGEPWTSLNTRILEVTADFKDITSENKLLEVTIPRGLIWAGIPVVEGKYINSAKNPIPMDRLNYQTQDPLKSAIVNTDLTGSAKATDFSQQVAGKLIYQFTPGTEKVVLQFIVNQDSMALYDKDIALKDNILVQLKKGADTVISSDSINNIHVGGINSKYIFKSTYGAKYLPQVIASTAEEKNYNDAYSLTRVSGGNYAKATVVMHYPKEMKYEDYSVITGSQYILKDKIEIDESTGTVKIPYSIFHYSNMPQVKYSIPEGTPLGTYTVSEKDYIEFEYFDGYKETIKVPMDTPDYEVEVVDSGSVVDKMNISVASHEKYIDNSIEDTFTAGPMFSVDNKTNLGNRKNHTVEFNIDPNWQVTRVNLPFDEDVVGNEITELYYKTSSSSDWILSSLRAKDLSTVGGSGYKILTKDKLKLKKGEYITDIKYKLKSFSSTYSTRKTGEHTQLITTYGKLEKTAKEATVKLSFYNENDKASTLVTKTGYVTKSERNIVHNANYSLKMYDNKNDLVSSVDAGQEIKVVFRPTMRSDFPDSVGMAIKNPLFYIVEVEGVHYQIDTLEITDYEGNVLPKSQYTLSERTANNGKTAYQISTNDTLIAMYYGDQLKPAGLQLSVKATIDLKFNSPNLDLAKTMYADGPELSTVNNGAPDVYDVDGDGFTTDLLLRGLMMRTPVVPNQNILIETYLSLVGEKKKDGYIEGNEKTLSTFTPGTQADYWIDILNNAVVSANKLDTYIPIPKTDQNFGKLFQKADFEWDMKLRSPVTLTLEEQKTFEILYTSTANESNYTDPAIYSTSPPSDISKVNMVLLKAKDKISAGASFSIGIPLEIDETEASAVDKIGKRNIYNPIYEVSSDKFKGTLQATKVGAELVIANIKGIVFDDKDSNGIYGASDLLLAGKKVELYKWSDANKQYEVALDTANKPVTATTNSNGAYVFDFHQNIGYGKYALKFETLDAQHRYTIYSNEDADNNSNVINVKNKPAVGDNYVGWILDIDATKSAASSLGTGIITYDPAILSITDINSTYELKNRNELLMNPTITPTNFDNIKDAKEGYKWELIDANDAQYVAIYDSTKKNATIRAIKVPEGNHPIGLRFTIKDIYGNTKEARTSIKVMTNDAPIITVPGVIERNVGDDWDPYDPNIVNGLGISDDHDTIAIDDIEVEESVPVGGKFLWLFKTRNTGKLTTPGTYKVTYSYTDSDNNTTSEGVKLKVHGLPYLEDAKGNSLDYENMPTKYYRVGGSADPFEDVKGYWEEASEQFGTATSKKEIIPGNDTTGGVAIKNIKDKEGQIVAGGIHDAGKYSADIEVNTPKNGKIVFTRNILARGDIETSVNPIAIKDDATNYTTLEEFLLKYNDKLQLDAKVDVPDENGVVTKQDVTEFELLEDINTISFDRADKSQPSSMTLHVLIHDRSDSRYKESVKTVPLNITLQDTTGQPPVITLKDGGNPTKRVSTDKVLHNAYAMNTKEEYEAAKDLALEENHEDPETIYNKLMADVTIKDQSASSGHVDDEGIKEKGIAKVVELDSLNESGNKETILIANDTEARTKQDILLSMYTKPGHYEVTYYAIDNDDNRVESSRHIHTSGATQFVHDLVDKKPIDESLNLRVNKVAYQPSDAQAYHLSYDGKAIHDTLVIAPGTVDISAPSVKEVEFVTTHHDTEYGETKVTRPSDVWKQKILVHGEIVLENITNNPENYFTDETVALDQATAYFEKATIDKGVVKTALAVSNSTGNDSLKIDDASIKRVTYRVDDGMALTNSKKTLVKEYHFYGMPEVRVEKDSISIGEHTTKQQVSDMINASGSVKLPNGGTDDLQIEHNYVDYTTTESFITITGTYTILGGKSKVVTKDITVNKVAKAMIEANDILLNEGDVLDIKGQSELTITHDYLTLDDIGMNESIPVSDGKCTTPGTYKVIFTALDKEGNQATKEIVVKVNGLATIKGLDTIQVRENTNINLQDNVSATYKKAGAVVGSTPSDEKINFSINPRYQKIDEEGNETTVNTLYETGVYEVVYTANNESGGKVEKKRTIIVHGKPTLEANAISIRIGESHTDFLNKFKNELNIQSEVLKVEYKDGKAVYTTINLLTEKKVRIDVSQVDFDKEGSYDAILTAIADDNDPILPSETITKTIKINVGKTQGEAPVVLTHDKKRQIDDPLFGGNNFKDYLLSENFIEVEKKDYDIQSIEIKSIEKEAKTRSGKIIDVNDNEALKEMMQTVGIYHINYIVEDTAGNQVEATQTFEISGMVEFGYREEEGNIVKINDVIEARQQSGAQYAPNELVAYQTGADGKQKIYPVQIQTGETSLDKITVNEITLTYEPSEATYENGAPRVVPLEDVKLLVQGNIEFLYKEKPIQDIQIYVGSTVKLDEIKANIKVIDKNGQIQTHELEIQYPVIETKEIGMKAFDITAEDTISNAPGKIQSIAWNVHVNGIPEIAVKNTIEIAKELSKNDIITQLDAQAFYMNSRKEKIDVTQNIQYGDIENGTMNLSIRYVDQGEIKVIETSVKITYLKDGETGNIEGDGNNGNQKPNGSIQTGDKAVAPWYLLLSVLSGFLIFFITVMLKKKKHEAVKS